MARVGIPKGRIITEEMLDVKRPGTGISPKYVTALVRRKAVSTIKKDELITWGKVR